MMVSIWSFCSFVPESYAGCRINYSFRNLSQSVFSLTNFQVKSGGGVWKNIGKYSHTFRKCHRFRAKSGKIRRRCHLITRRGEKFKELPPGSEIYAVYNASFSCKAKRRYRFIVKGNGRCTKNAYFPSATGWSRSTDINFGDISRYCR